MEQLKVNDIVTLKSGGPKMTIQVIKESSDGRGTIAFCKWYQETTNKFIEDWFVLSNLTPSL